MNSTLWCGQLNATIATGCYENKPNTFFNTREGLRVIITNDNDWVVELRI